MNKSRQVTLRREFQYYVSSVTCVNGAQTVSVLPVSPKELTAQCYLPRSGPLACAPGIPYSLYGVDRGAFMISAFNVRLAASRRNAEIMESFLDIDY